MSDTEWIKSETKRLGALSTEILSLNLKREHTPWWKIAKRRAMKREVIHLMAQHTVGVAQFVDRAYDHLCTRQEPHLHSVRCLNPEKP